VGDSGEESDFPVKDVVVVVFCVFFVPVVIDVDAVGVVCNVVVVVVVVVVCIVVVVVVCIVVVVIVVAVVIIVFEVSVATGIVTEGISTADLEGSGNLLYIDVVGDVIGDWRCWTV